jgi:hypothetical protein
MAISGLSRRRYRALDFVSPKPQQHNGGDAKMTTALLDRLTITATSPKPESRH